MKPLRAQDQPAGAELAAWKLLQSVDTEVALPELTAARILGRVSAMPRTPRGYPRWLVAAAAAALSLLCLQVATAAMLTGVPALRRALGAAITHRLGHPAEVVPVAPAPTGLAPVVSAAPPAIPPAPIAARPEAGARPAPVRGLVHREGPRPILSEGPSSSVPEVEVMTRAARELYADHDPLAALATLEPYLYLHAGGALRPDMIVAAVQANLELERTPEALSLLDGMVVQDFRGIPRASELRLLRGELLARSHRCQDALPVFEQSLAASNPLQRERALYGHAVCRAELGDVEGSRADLRAYLSEYPGGRFATDAERALDQTP